MKLEMFLTLQSGPIGKKWVFKARYDGEVTHVNIRRASIENKDVRLNCKAETSDSFKIVLAGNAVKAIRHKRNGRSGLLFSAKDGLTEVATQAFFDALEHGLSVNQVIATLGRNKANKRSAATKKSRRKAKLTSLQRRKELLQTSTSTEADVEWEAFSY